MNPKPAKRNHYNPCFWTAYWNPTFYRKSLLDPSGIQDPRVQDVHVLSIKANSVFTSKVENVHYDLNLGIAEITREAAEAFCRRHHPDRYEQFVSDNANASYPLYIDFEEILTGIEKTPPYRVLLTVIQRQDIASIEEKTFIGCFVVLQLIRSHAIMNSMIQFHSEIGIDKFECFVTLKWMLGDTNSLFRLVNPLVRSRWTLFPTDSDIFPLCDSPILVQPDSIMVALSPRLMLEISQNVTDGEDRWHRRPIDLAKLDEFRCRTIGNTFREVIFGHKNVLEGWQATPEFQRRVTLVRDLKAYNSLIKERQQEMWHINAFGNKE